MLFPTSPRSSPSSYRHALMRRPARIIVTSGLSTLWTRTWTSFPAFVMYGRPITSYSPLASTRRSPSFRCIGSTRCSDGCAFFFSCFLSGFYLAIRARLPALSGLRGEFSGNEGVEAAWRSKFCRRLFAPSSRMDDCPNSVRGVCGVAQDEAERARRAKPASRGRSSRLRASPQNAAYPSVSMSGASRSGLRRLKRPSRSGPSPSPFLSRSLLRRVSTFDHVQGEAGLHEGVRLLSPRHLDVHGVATVGSFQHQLRGTLQ
jgi:hypothetical protein